MHTILEAVSTIFRRWNEPKPLEIPQDQVLRDHRTPLFITLKEDHFRCEQAKIWFNPESHWQDIPPSSRIHQMALNCLTATAATTMRRLALGGLQKLYLQTQDSPSSDALAAFVRATAECVGSDLCQVKISDHTLRPDRQRRAEHTGPTSGMGMDPQLFDQYLTFGPFLWKIWSLHTLELELVDVLEFTDAFVERLADACPKVTHLRLCGPPFDKRSKPLDAVPGVTLHSLRILVEKCPELSELQIEFDATQPPDLDEGDDAPQIRGLTELGVGMSPIAQPEKVAAYITRLFPELFELSWYGGKWGQNEVELGRMGGWKCVQETMGLFSFRNDGQ